MMEYELFKGIVEEKILNYMGPEYANASVDVRPIHKVNQTLDALSIHNGEHEKISANIYINNMYEQYLKTEDLQQVLMDAANFYQRANEKVPVEYKELKFENVLDNVVFSLVNKEQNQEMLSKVVHREFQDMAVVYRWLVTKSEESISTSIVTNRLAESLNISEQQLYEHAMKNTPELMPMKVKSLFDVVMDTFCSESGVTREDAMEIGLFMMGSPSSETESIYVISNEMGIQGASAILLSDEMAKVADMVGTDLYLLPSSIHEMLAISTEFGSPEILQEMVQDVNMNAVSVKERLSNNVYLFDRETRTISMATDVPNKNLGCVVAEELSRYDNEPSR